MIGYVTLGTNDLDRAGVFYDELLAPLGAKRLKTSDAFTAWGKVRGAPMLMLIRPADGNAATVGNGVMAAIAVATQAEVETLFSTAMKLGMPDEGAPGFRGENFYGAYFRDPDGNKLCVFREDWLTCD